MRDRRTDGGAPAPRLRRWVLAALCAVTATFGLLRCTARAAAPPPDVLVLVLDTLRADRCGFLGAPRPTTPHLDRFAAQCLVFEDAWSAAPWTLPAHAALFTGRLPSECGLGDGRSLEIRNDVPTLAERLRAAGWRTGCFSCNGWLGPHTGLTRGFERVEPLHLASAGGSAAAAHARAEAWMAERRRAGERFFAFVNDVEPHAPWNPPDAFRERFLRPGHAPDLVERLRNRSVMASWGDEPLPDPDDPGVRAVASDLYDGDVAHLDAEVGALLDRMEAEGLLANTLVVVASDHGECLGDHGWMEHGLLLHRELLRVPLLVRLPDGSGARRVRDVVRLEDVFATVLDACGVRPPEGVRSRSLLDDTEGRVAVAEERLVQGMVPLASRILGPDRAPLAARGRRSVYDGRLHLIHEDGAAPQLYDLADDPQELRDLAPARPDDVARLRGHLPPPAPR